ncbi:MAG: chemotaxis protein CheW [Gracilibacteraceae bacterium]|jgi:purine-binding chemotaxis protein CheW|nr:chemotaxis protein CheW [Gracilibacteraceae bacterium]
MNEIVAQETENTLRGKYLTFMLDEQCFGLDIEYILEIIGVQVMTRVPKIPPYIKGIMNLRGKVIPIIDMRLRFNKATREYDAKTCIIVVEVDEDVVGLVVDAIDEVVDIADEYISAPPGVSSDYTGNFMKGVAQEKGRVRLLLDCRRILRDSY